MKMKKCREPFVARHASDRARSRWRHCCWTTAGPPAYERAKRTTTEACAARQSGVTKGDLSIIAGMKPAAAYFVAQFVSPVRPHWRGASHDVRHHPLHQMRRDDRRDDDRRGHQPRPGQLPPPLRGHRREEGAPAPRRVS